MSKREDDQASFDQKLEDIRCQFNVVVDVVEHSGGRELFVVWKTRNPFKNGAPFNEHFWSKRFRSQRELRQAVDMIEAIIQIGHNTVTIGNDSYSPVLRDGGGGIHWIAEERGGWAK